jgi:hypothetical protein
MQDMAIALCWFFPDDDFWLHQWRAPSLDERSCGAPRYQGSVFGFSACQFIEMAALSCATALMRCSELKNHLYDLGFLQHIE